MGKKAFKKRCPKNVHELIAKFMGENEGLPAGFIAEKTGVSYGTALKYLKELEYAGYALSYPHPEALAGLINYNTKLWILTCEGHEQFLYNHHSNN